MYLNNLLKRIKCINITNLHLAHRTRPLIAAAGTDITYWFDPKTKEPRK